MQIQTLKKHVGRLIKNRSIDCIVRCVALSSNVLFAFSCWTRSPIPCHSTTGTVPLGPLTSTGAPATSSTGAARRRLRRTSVIFGPCKDRHALYDPGRCGTEGALFSHHGPPGRPVRADRGGDPLISAFSSRYRQSDQRVSAPGWNRDCVNPKTLIIAEVHCTRKIPEAYIE